VYRRDQKAIPASWFNSRKSCKRRKSCQSRISCKRRKRRKRRKRNKRRFACAFFRVLATNAGPAHFPANGSRTFSFQPVSNFLRFH